MAGSGTAHLRPEGETLLRVENLTVEFPVGRTGLKVHAVSDVSIDIREGETVGLVGESGCGKSTTGRAIIQLPAPKSGRVVFDGIELTSLEGEELRKMRPRLQMVFQDPISSLNPRRRVEDIVGEGLRIWAPPIATPVAMKIAAVLTWIVGVGAALLAIGLMIATIATGLGWEDIFLVPIIAAGGFGVTYLWYAAGRGLFDTDRWWWQFAIALHAVHFIAVGLLVLGGAVLGVVDLAISGVAIALLLLPSSRRAVPAKPPRFDEKVDEVLDAVGLDPAVARGRRPFQFSGGQCQRISIARAVVTDPKVIICDEPVSALDVSVQAQILNLLEEMKKRYGLTLVFIAHDLAVVKNVSDRVVVMYLGKVCEVAPPDTLYAHPAHPYTAALLAAIPIPDPSIRPEERTKLRGEIPSPIAPPSGCRFRTRCPKAQEKCAAEEPQIREISPGQYVACHFPLAEGEMLPSSNGQGAIPGGAA